jgi:hypothetical protein
MPDPGDVVTIPNCVCCGSSSSSVSSSSSSVDSNPICCSFDPAGLNCIYNNGLGFAGGLPCASTKRSTPTITAASMFGTRPLTGSQCNNWIDNFCTTSGAATYIVAQITNNIWTVVWPCPSIFFGLCSGSNYTGSAVCAGPGTVITLSNTGAITSTCPSTLVVTLTW